MVMLDTCLYNECATENLVWIKAVENWLYLNTMGECSFKGWLNTLLWPLLSRIRQSKARLRRDSWRILHRSSFNSSNIYRFQLGTNAHSVLWFIACIIEWPAPWADRWREIGILQPLATWFSHEIVIFSLSEIFFFFCTLVQKNHSLSHQANLRSNPHIVNSYRMTSLSLLQNGTKNTCLEGLLWWLKTM